MMKKPAILMLFTTLFILATATWAAAAEGVAPGVKTVTTEELKALLNSGKGNPLLIDARTPEEYEEVHIKNAVSIPVSKLEKDATLLPADKSRLLVFYCNGVKCGKSSKAAKIALANGYTNIIVYAEGMPVWEEKGMPIYAGPTYEKRIETSKMAPKELQELMSAKPGTFTIVDVRDASEYADGHIPGAINIPVSGFAAGSGVLEKNKKIIVYCNSGGRSYNAYRKLIKLAYPDIHQVIFADWQTAGLPVEKSAAAH